MTNIIACKIYKLLITEYILTNKLQVRISNELEYLLLTNKFLNQVSLFSILEDHFKALPW